MADEIVKAVAHNGIRIVVQQDGDKFFYVTSNGLYAGGFATAEAAVEDAKETLDRR